MIFQNAIAMQVSFSLSHSFLEIPFLGALFCLFLPYTANEVMLAVH